MAASLKKKCKIPLREHTIFKAVESNSSRRPFSHVEVLVMKRKAVVFTGAGMSAPSGISTFRSIDGLWQKPRK